MAGLRESQRLNVRPALLLDGMRELTNVSESHFLHVLNWERCLSLPSEVVVDRSGKKNL